MDSAIHRIAIIEDHRLQRKYTIGLLNAQADMRVVFSGEDLVGFTTWLETTDVRQHPDLIVLDLLVDRGASAEPETVRQLLAEGFRIILFSALTSVPLARRMVHAGVHGMISKRESEATILSALRTVLGGKEWMSPDLAALIAHDPNRPRLSGQEERALILYASGLPIDAVSASIGVMPGTARKYLQRVREKYSAVNRPMTSRLDWFITATKDGYLTPSEWTTSPQS